MNTCPHRPVSLVELRNLTPIPFRLSLDATVSTSLSSFDYRLYRKSHLIISPIPFKLSFQQRTEVKPPSSGDSESALRNQPGSRAATPSRLSLGGSLPRMEIGSTGPPPKALTQITIPEHQNTPASANPSTTTPAIRHAPLFPSGSPLRRPKRKAPTHPSHQLTHPPPPPPTSANAAARNAAEAPKPARPLPATTA
ncbi:uncharacterized protein LAJ45_10130 [Morchella importuna]|uniref:uncharacterized protein n=1 Tax=Morchella importuna TaxID=1174673 RepID=UPI001E8D73AF|nr:uncharacterized protein LAJ45_10130 [Morchella importuna]KAH8145807.1 hypothetical protein LAJ45_10130 [Morchella importuna]